MKKNILTVCLIVSLGVPAFAGDNAFNSFFESWWSFNKSVDTKIALLQKKNEKQQQKFEAKKKEREQKILEQQKKRQEVYDANQKRLEEKREQLKKLLEE